MKQCHVLQCIPVIGNIVFADDPNALDGITTHHHISINHVHTVGPKYFDDDDDDTVVHTQLDGHDSVTTTTATNLGYLDDIIRINAGSQERGRFVDVFRCQDCAHAQNKIKTFNPNLRSCLCPYSWRGRWAEARRPLTLYMRKKTAMISTLSTACRMSRINEEGCD